MSTATIEGRRERLDRLREERIPARRARLEELEERVAEAVAGGDDAGELREELREVREDLENYEAAAPILERRVREEERERLQEEAEARLRSVRKKVGGLVGEAPRRAERARELAEKLAKQLRWLAGAPFRRTLLKAEARVLADRFDLGEPDLRSFEEGPKDAVFEVRRAVRAVSGPRESLGIGLDDPGKVVHLLGELYGDESPLGDLLERLQELDGAGEGG